MAGVLAGFASIAIVIAIGWLLAYLGILDGRSQVSLAKLTFYVGAPALLITMLGSADVEKLFSSHLVASITGVVVTAMISVSASRVVFGRSAQDTVIAGFCSSYVNAGNLGIPIATYAIGDASVLAPMLLTQLVVLQPAGLAVLDILGSRGGRPISKRAMVLIAMARPIKNPMMIGALIGLLLAVSGGTLPDFIGAPIDILAGLAVPCMLISFGISLRSGPPPGRGGDSAQLILTTALKLIAQPLVVALVAIYGLGLDGKDLLAIIVIAALPTAQNVFVFAVRYQAAIPFARDCVLWTTILSVPVIIVIHRAARRVSCG